MDWFETWFDTPYYHILYKNHDFREAEDFITKLTDDLKLPPGAKVIDLACGKGRHSLFLNKLGYNVLGLDLSRRSIAHNKTFENEMLSFRVHDMRDQVDGAAADAVFNLFTSFGYFDNEEDDEKVFQSVSNILKKDGFFVLDYLNEQYVRDHLVKEEAVEREGIVFNIKKKIEDSFIIKEIKFNDNGRPYSFYEKVKLHTPENILKYASAVGLQRKAIWGSYDLADFDEKASPRCINLFVKA